MVPIVTHSARCTHRSSASLAVCYSPPPPHSPFICGSLVQPSTKMCCVFVHATVCVDATLYVPVVCVPVCLCVTERAYVCVLYVSAILVLLSPSPLCVCVCVCVPPPPTSPAPTPSIAFRNLPPKDVVNQCLAFAPAPAPPPPPPPPLRRLGKGWLVPSRLDMALV